MKGGDTMAKEPFLINSQPRKAATRKARKFLWSKPTASKLGKAGTRHRPVVYSMGGHWQTSLASRVAKPGFRLNPRKRSNPLGEMAMIVGANPKRRNKMARKRYRRNPVSVSLSQVKGLAPMIGGAIVGAAAVNVVPNIFNLGGWMRYGAQAATVVGGGIAMNKVAGRSASDGFVVGGATMVLYGVVKNLLGGTMTMLGLGEDTLEAFPDRAYAAFPDQSYAGNQDYSMDYSMPDYAM